MLARQPSDRNSISFFRGVVSRQFLLGYVSADNLRAEHAEQKDPER
jgi:hypothetical protein